MQIGLFVAFYGILNSGSIEAEDRWPQWRGADQSGYAADAELPDQWSDESGIRWTSPIPGRGGSSPIWVGDQIYLTSGAEGKNHLLAIKPDGQIAWTVALGEDRGPKHQKGSGSNPSPVSDGQHIFAYFRSGDLACVSPQGEVAWHINLQEKFGEDTLWWDLGTSPVLTDNAVVCAVMQSGPSFLVAFDRKTGRELWKQDRVLDAPEEAAHSYSTPIVMNWNGQQLLAVLGADHLTVHRADNGKELYRVGGFNPDRQQFWRSIASPVASGELIICPYARGDTLTAISLPRLAAGEESIVWQRDDLGSDVPTPAVHDGKLFLVNDGGRVACLDVRDGQTIWEGSLPKSRVKFSSSPVLTKDRMYVIREDGTAYVLATDRFEILHENRLEAEPDIVVATPMPFDHALLIRLPDRLVCAGP
jgi:outer membrane protein assembly factor BamB